MQLTSLTTCKPLNHLGSKLRQGAPMGWSKSGVSNHKSVHSSLSAIRAPLMMYSLMPMPPESIPAARIAKLEYGKTQCKRHLM